MCRRRRRQKPREVAGWFKLEGLDRDRHSGNPVQNYHQWQACDTHPPGETTGAKRRSQVPEQAEVKHLEVTHDDAVALDLKEEEEEVKSLDLMRTHPTTF